MSADAPAPAAEPAPVVEEPVEHMRGIRPGPPPGSEPPEPGWVFDRYKQAWRPRRVNRTKKRKERTALAKTLIDEVKADEVIQGVIQEERAKGEAAVEKRMRALASRSPASAERIENLTGVHGDPKPLAKLFDVEDWRKRLQGKSMEAAELALDEIRERMADPIRSCRIPTATLVRVIKYLDERNVEIAKRMKEEGLEKNAKPVEQNNVFNQTNIFPMNEVHRLPADIREKMMLRQLAVARGENPDEDRLALPG